MTNLAISDRATNWIGRHTLNSSSRAHRRCELRCAIAHRGIHMDELLCFKHSQEFLCLFTCREAAYLNVVRVVLRRAWRTQSDELTAMPPDNLRQVLAVERRHVPRAATRALVVARAGPLISPYPFASVASVKLRNHAIRITYDRKR